VGQKTNPISLRLRINRKQDSSWFADHKYTKTLVTEIRIRKYLERLFTFSRLPTSRIIVQLLPKKINLYPFFKHYKFSRKKTASRARVLNSSLRKKVINECKQKRKKIFSDARVLAPKERKQIQPKPGLKTPQLNTPVFLNVVPTSLRSPGFANPGVYTTISDITKFLKKKKDAGLKNQEYTKNLKKYYVSNDNARVWTRASQDRRRPGVVVLKTPRLCERPGDKLKIFVLRTTTQCHNNTRASHPQSTPRGYARVGSEKDENPVNRATNPGLQLKKKLEVSSKGWSTPKKIKFYKYHKRLFKLSSSGLFLRKRPSCFASMKSRPTPVCSEKLSARVVVPAHSEKPRGTRPDYRSPSEPQDLLFLKYLLKQNTPGLDVNPPCLNAIQNSFFFFQGALRSKNHARPGYKNIQASQDPRRPGVVSPYLLTNSIENIESILYKTLKCNTSVLPLKIKNPLKSAYFLALFIGNGIKQKRSLRQIFKLITKMKKKSETSLRTKNARFRRPARVWTQASKDSRRPGVVVSRVDAKRATIKGIRILCSGRINGVEKAKTQSKKLGQTSLHFFSEKIDYSSIHVNTKFGIIGVKVWICFKK